MTVPVSLGSSLPRSLDNFIKRTVAEGAAPVPNVQLETRVPEIGPYVLNLGDAQFNLTVYPGPRMWFDAQPVTGTQINTSA
jgi:hypothetical protein